MPLNLSTYQRTMITGAVAIGLMACSSLPTKSEQSAAEQRSQSSAQATATTRKAPTPMLTLKGHSERIASVVFSPDGQLIASASYDNIVKLWNPKTGQTLRTFSVEPSQKERSEGVMFSTVSSLKLSFSQDGRILSLGNGHNALISWQVDTGEVVTKVEGRGGYLASFVFSPDGNLLANAIDTNRNFLTRHDLIGLSSEQILEKVSQSFSRSSLLPEAGEIGIWDVRTGQRISTILNTSFVASMAFSSNNQFLVSTGLDNKSRLWDLNSKQLLREWQGVRTIAISPDGKFIAGDSCRTVKVWNRRTGEEVYSLGGIVLVEALAFSSNSKTLAAIHLVDNTLRIWDLTTGQSMGSLPSLQAFAVAISPNNELIATGNFDNTVRVWKIR